MVFSLDIPSAQSFKAEAKALRAEHEARGKPITHSAALELVAHRHGYRDWNTAIAAAPEKAPNPLQVGQRVAGTYLKQPFVGIVLGVQLLADMQHYKLTIKFDQPVDVVTSELFSAFRQRVTATVDMHGVTPAKTSDGEPHMRVRRV